MPAHHRRRSVQLVVVECRVWGNLCGFTLALLDLLLQYLSVLASKPAVRTRQTYQSLHGAVESMSVVSPELGVGSFERGVAVGLGLLDAFVL